MKDSTILSITGLICGTVTMIYCIYKGYDHALVAGFFTLIGTIVGYTYGKMKK